jgi:enoyl-CoA hydratase/carnithine racemase
VTSGFPQSQLGVGIAHPAFPHEVNRVFEIVEGAPSDITRLLWAIGLIPMPVSDNWSFVLDVLFCGITLAAIRYHEATNMPFWKVDKYVRQLAGPNPLRAHDAIGAAGASFLTWSCLHHLNEQYGELYRPSDILIERKETGQPWYPPDHFRPLVNWALDDAEHAELRTRILGPLYQMTSLLVHEDRSHLSQINIIGELCAQFSHGVLAMVRRAGPEAAIATVEAYHRLHPEAAGSAWHPDAFERVSSPAWQQLYVNAEHDGAVGVISIGRESYSWDVDAELNRAIDWLTAEGIERVVLTHDFHIATQLVGADTTEFYPALTDIERGTTIPRAWSRTARRLHDGFAASVGLIAGKRCLGGMLELLLHCHYVVAVDDSELGMPEVTLPVLPGMEFCHWPFRRTSSSSWPKLLELVLAGRSVRGRDAVGWLIDSAGPLHAALETAWQAAAGGAHRLKKRSLVTGALEHVTEAMPRLDDPGDPNLAEARRAIVETIESACSAPLAEALDIQARRSGAFMSSIACRNGAIGAAFRRTMVV